MTRKKREERIIPLQPNHIVCRGNNRRRLFSYPRDYLTYLGLLGAVCKKFECMLHAICLMNNHVHLLLTPPSVKSASETMKRVNQRYAQVRNAQYGGSGKLFEARFESEPIESNSHLQFSVLYINANPHTAQLPSKDQYRWSTHAFHSGEASKLMSDIITLDHWYASLGSTDTERAAIYRTCFKSYLAGKVDARYLKAAHRMEPRFATHRPARPDGTSATEPVAKYAKSPVIS